jgi:hypothetical protein
MMICCQELSLFAFCVPALSVLIILESLLVQGIPGISLVPENAEKGFRRPAFAASWHNAVPVKAGRYGISSFARQRIPEYAFHNLRLFGVNLKIAVFPSVAVGWDAYLIGLPYMYRYGTVSRRSI